MTQQREQQECVQKEWKLQLKEQLKDQRQGSVLQKGQVSSKGESSGLWLWFDDDDDQ